MTTLDYDQILRTNAHMALVVLVTAMLHADSSSPAVAAPPASESTTANFPLGCSENDALSTVSNNDDTGVVSKDGVLVRRCIRGTTLPGNYSGGLEGFLFFHSYRDGILHGFGGSQGFNGLQTNHLERLRTRPHFVWDLLIPNGKSAVPKRISAAGIFDPFHRRLIMYGGQDIFAAPGTDKGFNDTWVYPVDDKPKDWTPLNIAPPQYSRFQAKAVLDPIGQRMIVFGGDNATGKLVGNQTLALTLEPGKEVWSELLPSVKPPGDYERIYHGFAYDSRRHRVVVLGGGQLSGVQAGAFGDAWALPLDDPSKGWYPLVFANDPPGPYFVAMNMFYDVVSDAFYIYFGAVYEQPKKWLLGQEIAQIREVWQMKPAGSNSMV